jgi:hypothetical protein
MRAIAENCPMVSDIHTFAVKRAIQLVTATTLLGLLTASAAENRLKLLPQLRPGQTITYLIRYRSDKNVKTGSNVVAPMITPVNQQDSHGLELFQIDVEDVQQRGGMTEIRARGRFLHQDARLTTPEGQSIEFTISSGGSARNVSGFDALLPEEQLAWQEWVARFAVAWTLPAAGVKLGEKWKSEQAEQAGTPIAELVWLRESTYVRNEPCRSAQMSPLGEPSASSGPADTCAVLLTTAKLKQQSSSKDATPEDFKLHELKTTGTAKGTNEIITYVSLRTGLVMRATEEASQSMDVTVAKSDGSNRVHYNVDAKSHSEVLLVTDTPLTRP